MGRDTDRCRRRRAFVSFAAVWVIAIVMGLWTLWRYDHTPGAAADPPRTWPSSSGITRSANQPTLVMSVHPRCACSRASLEELDKLMARAGGAITAQVLVLHPSDVPGDWSDTGLWRHAAAIPGVTVTRDDGTEANRFGALTSGQTVLYSADGWRLFTGGLTESRGHSGASAGRDAILALLKDDLVGTDHTPVFGCSLFAGDDATSGETGASL